MEMTNGQAVLLEGIYDEPTPEPGGGHEASLASVEEKRQLIRDRVWGVAKGFATGLYLWGEGGISKSFTVEEALRASGTPYKASNSRVTAKGLFELLRDYPDVVHLIEDAETLFADKNAFGVLRSALWGQPGKERVVTWQTARVREEFVFAGGLILVANCPLEDVPQLRALRTRITCLEFRPTTAEVEALMRHVAGRRHGQGPYRLSPEECLEVAEEVITRSRRLRRPLDLRLLVNALQDRLQWEAGLAETPWLDLLESRLKERVVSPEGRPETPAQRKARERALVLLIGGLPPKERLARWKAETGKSQAALYRLLNGVA
jgi:hypothetical protein